MTIKIREVEEIISSRKLKEQELNRLETRLEVEQENYKSAVGDIITELESEGLKNVTKKNAVKKMRAFIEELEGKIEEEMSS